MKRMVAVMMALSGIIFCLAYKQPVSKSAIGIDSCLQYYKKASAEFTQATRQLQQAVAAITTDSNTVLAAKLQLTDCRKSYKKIEFFVEYFMENRIRIFNQAPVYEIEEPYMEYQHPIGMQAMEAILFEENVFGKKDELTAQAEVINTTAAGLVKYLYGKQITDADILEAMRLELVRIYTLGITGYDAPELKTGIAEANTAMQAIEQNLQPYLSYQRQTNSSADSVSLYLQTCITQLSVNTSFNSFDRASFFTESALPLQQQLGRFIKNMGLQKRKQLF